MSNLKFDVFISYKFHGNNSETLPDYYMAKELYEKLKSNGIDAFFSDSSLIGLASSDYKRLIDKCLDDAKLLIVVATKPEYCDSNWVRYEWDSFYNDILSSRKDGCLVSYLDTDDIGAFPRTIRSLQVFEKKADGLNSAVEFAKSYLGKDSHRTHNSDDGKGSSYNYDSIYELGDEKKRLDIQGKLESVQDKRYLKELFSDTSKPCRILDVGCSVGTVTFDVLGSLPNAEILGVDKFESCVAEFNEKSPSASFFAEQLNFEDCDWEDQLSRHMANHNIEKFDLIYCSLSLHHMSNSFSVVKKLWHFLEDDGYIYIRTCDDGMKIAYPDASVIYDLVNKTAKVSRASDRFHGRKVYSMLQKAKFKDIHIIPVWNDTANKSMDERYALYYSGFVWRKNYFKNCVNSAETSDELEKAMAEYDEVINMLDKIENMFSDMSFYFGHGFIVAYAQKKRILL